MKTLCNRLLLVVALAIAAPYAAMAQSYPEKIGEKLGNGLANVVTGVVEIPKTIAITSRTHNAGYAATAGLMIGIANMLGRTLLGTVDLATFMVPTKALVKPDYIWNNFDQKTSYNRTWQLR